MMARVAQTESAFPLTHTRPFSVSRARTHTSQAPVPPHNHHRNRVSNPKLTLLARNQSNIIKLSFISLMCVFDITNLMVFRRSVRTRLWCLLSLRTDLFRTLVLTLRRLKGLIAKRMCFLRLLSRPWETTVNNY